MGSILLDHRTEILDLAFASIRHGIASGQLISLEAASYHPALKSRRATFVTLTKNGNLRGCIGSLQAVRPLVVDVTRNAFAAAFADPRFTRVSAREVQTLRIQISMLSEFESLSFQSESDLISQLRPGIDGLVLEDRTRKGTFLPSVWESFPEPQDFLNQLKRKAGLAENYWSERIRVSRYSTESISGPD